MGRTREFLETIKFEHTVFALPFAYLSLFLVESGWPTLGHFGWVTLAMVTARTLGMAANRVIDAGVDARNPRTASRAVPAGRLSKASVLAFMVLSLALFLVAVWNLAPLCRKLWPVVIAAMVFYPYAKRFTWLAHMFLGLVYFMIPTGIWVAVTNTVTPESMILGAGAALWVAGFDIIYACQDVDVDRRERLHSIPADFGLAPGLWVARLFHVGFIVALLWAGLRLQLGGLYYVGLAVTALLTAYEHRLVSPDDLSKVNVAFFTTNGIISMALFVMAALDAVL